MLDVLFLYKDYAYNYSIISTVNVLAEHGIRLECHHCETKQQAEMQRRKCDLLLLHPEFFPGEDYCRENSVAIVSDVDGGWCSPHINLIPHVKGFIESYAYIPRTLHNLKYYCYCTELMKQAGCKRKTDVPNTFNISDYPLSDLNKIHVHCGFGSW